VADDDRMLVLYHAGCNDGWCAAVVAAHRFTVGDVQLVPAPYGSPPPVTLDDVCDRDVLVLDVTWPLEEVIGHMTVARSFEVFDHHSGAAGRMEDYREETDTHVVFDESRSGARIAWDELMGGDPPWLVQYVQDRDLWHFKLAASAEINAYLKALPHELDVWFDLLQWTTPPMYVRDGGAGILMRDARHIEYIMRNADEVTLGGYTVPAVNSCVLPSELGHALAPEHPFAAVWYEIVRDGEAQIRVSLRSNKNGVDVSEVAKRYGGGGHKHAAGFTVSWGRWIRIMYACDDSEILSVPPADTSGHLTVREIDG